MKPSETSVGACREAASETRRTAACVNFCAGVDLPLEAGVPALQDRPAVGMLADVVDALETCYAATLRGVHAFATEDEMVQRMAKAQEILRAFGRRT